MPAMSGTLVCRVLVSHTECGLAFTYGHSILTNSLPGLRFYWLSIAFSILGLSMD